MVWQKIYITFFHQCVRNTHLVFLLLWLRRPWLHVWMFHDSMVFSVSKVNNFTKDVCYCRRKTSSSASAFRRSCNGMPPFRRIYVGTEYTSNKMEKVMYTKSFTACISSYVRIGEEKCEGEWGDANAKPGCVKFVVGPSCQSSPFFYRFSVKDVFRLNVFYIRGTGWDDTNVANRLSV